MSKPSEFNDPFDCIGAAVGDYSEKVIADFVDENYTAEFGSKEDFRRAFIQTYKDQEDSLLVKRTHLDGLCLILCMVDAKMILPRNELLMWSHYAKDAKGVRFLFDIPETDDSYVLARVNYQSKIPCAERTYADSYQRGPSFVFAYRDWICTKGEAWRYEEEVRLILHRPDMWPYHIEVNGLSFFKMPKEWIKEITFGSEADMQTANVYVDFLRQAGFGHIVFRRAIKKKCEYGLDYGALP